MHKPVLFSDIYQPTTLVIKGPTQRQQQNFAYESKTGRSIVAGREQSHRPINVESFLESSEDAVIFAGPGWGKTTFIHYIYQRFVDTSNVYPLLITLRRPNAVEDLVRFVDCAETISKKSRDKSILLLVDGYDEIGLEQRRTVSEALLRFQGFRVGKFYLTCREFYDVVNLYAAEVRIGGFSRNEKYKFVDAFLRAFESDLSAKEVVDELEDRGFGDFLSHPLLLALACIVKTSPSSVQPRSALRLLERAIDVLSERWDGSKGLVREAATPLDGRDRIQVLKRVAYVASSSYISKTRAEIEAQKQIDLMNVSKVDAKRALLETARFYGILVPAEDGWEFVHRTVHDYLAASYWVECGGFAAVKNPNWTARTAYAACLLQDATAVFSAALSAPDGLPVVAEMLSNAAQIDAKVIAKSLHLYFAKPGRCDISSEPNKTIFTATLSSDFLRLASTRLLDRLIDVYAKDKNPINEAITAYCLIELKERNLKLDFVTHGALKDAYSDENFIFQVPGLGRVSIGEMNPASGKVSALAAASRK